MNTTEVGDAAGVCLIWRFTWAQLLCLVLYFNPPRALTRLAAQVLLMQMQAADQNNAPRSKDAARP